jgi:integrase
VASSECAPPCTNKRFGDNAAPKIRDGIEARLFDKVVLMEISTAAREYADLTFFTPATHETFLRAVRLFSARANVRYVHDINTQALIQFKKETLARAKPITLNGYIRYLRLFGDYLVERGYFSTNVFRQLKLATPGHRQHRVLDAREIARAIQVIEQDGDRYHPPCFWLAVIKTLYYTGMRRRQLTAIQVGDVDALKSELLLAYRGSKTHREWVIPIHDELAPVLLELFDRLRLALGRPLRPSDALFNRCFLGRKYARNAQQPDAISPRTITDFFKRLRKEDGIKLSAHGFRHTFATNLCNPTDGSPDLPAIQQLLGHTTMQTTRGYVQVKTRSMVRTLRSLNPIE